MKFFILFLLVALHSVVGSIDDSSDNPGSCSGGVKGFCSSKDNPVKCTAALWKTDRQYIDFVDFIDKNFKYSMKFLDLHFYISYHESTRPGFSKFFRSLSDDTWHDALEVIRLLGRKGHPFKGVQALRRMYDHTQGRKAYRAGSHEILSLTDALDIYKDLAATVASLSREILTRHFQLSNNSVPMEADIDTFNYLQEDLAKKYTDRNFQLAHLINQLVDMRADKHVPFGITLQMFDENLASL